MQYHWPFSCINQALKWIYELLNFLNQILQSHLTIQKYVLINVLIHLLLGISNELIIEDDQIRWNFRAYNSNYDAMSVKAMSSYLRGWFLNSKYD